MRENSLYTYEYALLIGTDIMNNTIFIKLGNPTSRWEHTFTLISPTLITSKFIICIRLAMYGGTVENSFQPVSV
jgi:predicted transglutaminase-like protease